jgi:hypothetical protein
MNYIKLYEKIIDNAECQNRIKTKNGIKYEKHHIIPKSLGGKNNSGNLVLLTPKEHYLCHKLLVEIYKNTPYSNKMYYAMWCMINGNGNQSRYSPTSRIYELFKIELSKIQSYEGKKKGMPAKALLAAHKSRLGSKHTDESKEKMRIAKLGKPAPHNKKPKPEWLKELLSKNSKNKERFNNRKKVSQYDIMGNLIESFNSIKEASEITNIDRKKIEQCLRKKSKTTNNYRWEYSNDNPKNNIGILVFEKPGRKQGGIPWNKGKKNQQFCYKHNKIVSQYTLDGLFIKTWDCIKAAAIELNIHRGSIENCSLGKSKSSGGFIWKYDG